MTPEAQLDKRSAAINTELSGLTYNYFGCSGPITARQKSEFLKAHGFDSDKAYVDHWLAETSL